jgi:hypothetical protein
MNSIFDGDILGGQPEGVKTHWEKDVIAFHGHVPGLGIGGSDGVPMAYMKVPAGIGIHGQGVMFRLAGVFYRFIQAFLFPTFPPFSLNFNWIVFHFFECSCFYIITFRNLRFPRKFFNRFLKRAVAATKITSSTLAHFKIQALLTLFACPPEVR